MSKLNLTPENALKDVFKDLSASLVLSSKTDKHYPEELNPFQPALSKIRINEYENRKLSEFLEKAILAQKIDELNKIIDYALYSGVRINACGEDGFSFSDIIIFKIFNYEFKQNERENIIKKLALNGADFDEQSDKKIVEICNKVKKEVEPHIYNRLKKLREAAENAAITGDVESVEIDNKTFFIKFSYNSKVEVAKIVESTKNLGLSKGDLKIGGNILKIGSGEVEIKTEENGKRNYVDVSDNSSFIIAFPTSLGELHVRVYDDAKSCNQVRVEIEDQEIWNELQKIGEKVGRNCLFGGMSINTTIEKGYFMRPGRSESSEVIKRAGPKSSETIYWVDKVKSYKTTSLER
ncbi:MAG: hypothetical protein PV345_05455 [Wolbachia sp.]|nr:hypothetical protein [Wolbachia sp.]